MKKYEYNYKEVTTKGFLFFKFEEHREIIEKCGQHGYRYVGYMPTQMGHDGAIYKMDLIFEREIED